MKTIMMALLSTLLAPISSFACGMGTNAFDGDVDLAWKASESSLVCEIGGQTSQTELKLYAIYRCVNSPVTGVVVMNGEEAELVSIRQLEEGKIELLITGDARPVTCQMTARK